MIEEEKKRFPLYEGKCIIYGRGRDKRWGARIGNRDCWRHLHGIDYVPNIWLLDPLLAQTSKHLFVSYYCSVVFRQEHHIKLIANNYSHGKKKSRGLINFFSGKQTMYSTNMKLNYQYSLYYTNMKLNYLPFYILNNKTCTYHIRLNYMVVK